MKPSRCIPVLLAVLVGLAGVSGPARAGDQALSCGERMAQAVATVAAQGLGAALKDVPADQREQAARDYAAAIRYLPDRTGYLFIYRNDGVNVALPTWTEMQGKSLLDHTDSKGAHPIREFIAAAKAGGGFVEYWWTKPGTTQEFHKKSYILPVPGLDWFLGAGVYEP